MVSVQGRGHCDRVARRGEEGLILVAWQGEAASELRVQLEGASM